MVPNHYKYKRESVLAVAIEKINTFGLNRGSLPLFLIGYHLPLQSRIKRNFIIDISVIQVIRKGNRILIHF